MNIRETNGVSAVRKLYRSGVTDPRMIARKTGYTLGTVRSYLSALRVNGWNAHHASQHMSAASALSHSRPHSRSTRRRGVTV